jgi:hypothetical protein
MYTHVHTFTHTHTHALQRLTFVSVGLDLAPQRRLGALQVLDALLQFGAVLVVDSMIRRTMLKNDYY